MLMQDYKRALYDFSAAIRTENRNPKGTDNRKLSEFYLYAGQSHQLLGCYEEAITHYDIAIRKNETFSALYYNRGITNAGL
jgi:tetratricopeptide (TPR) repeat protein